MSYRRKQKGYVSPIVVREIVPDVLRALKPRRREMDAVVRAWEDVVGVQTAARTRVVMFKGGVLTLEVASSALKHDLLTFRKNQLLGRLKEKLSGVEIRDLKCRVGSPS